MDEDSEDPDYFVEDDYFFDYNSDGIYNSSSNLINMANVYIFDNLGGVSSQLTASSKRNSSRIRT